MDLEFWIKVVIVILLEVYRPYILRMIHDARGKFSLVPYYIRLMCILMTLLVCIRKVSIR